MVSIYKHRVTLTISCLFLISLQGCYYDVEEELYPDSVICDTSAVTYSGDVKAVLDNNCNSCHSQLVAQGGIVLDNYTSVKSVAGNGVLLGAIRHDSGFSPMPQGASKLSDCIILKIEKWVADGSLNN